MATPPRARSGSAGVAARRRRRARAKVALRERGGGGRSALPPHRRLLVPIPLLGPLPAAAPMRRKQKRLLQAVGLALAALVFLPNVGLWSLYRERQLEGGGAAGGDGAANAGAAAGEAPVSGRARGAERPRVCRGGGGGGSRWVRVGGLSWEPPSHGECAELGATRPHHRMGREAAAAPIRGGGKGGKPGRVPVVPGKELFVVSCACVGWGARVLSWRFTGAGTGGSPCLLLAEHGKVINKVRSLLLALESEEGEPVLSCIERMPVPFPKGVPPCHFSLPALKRCGTQTSPVTVRPRRAQGEGYREYQVELEDYVSGVMLLWEKRSG